MAAQIDKISAARALRLRMAGRTLFDKNNLIMSKALVGKWTPSLNRRSGDDRIFVTVDGNMAELFIDDSWSLDLFTGTTICAFEVDEHVDKLVRNRIDEARASA
jgi:hypothetical protein